MSHRASILAEFKVIKSLLAENFENDLKQMGI